MTIGHPNSSVLAGLYLLKNSRLANGRCMSKIHFNRPENGPNRPVGIIGIEESGAAMGQDLLRWGIPLMCLWEFAHSLMCVARSQLRILPFSDTRLLSPFGPISLILLIHQIWIGNSYEGVRSNATAHSRSHGGKII